MYMVSKELLLEKAIHDCRVEMYAKAQPEADWDNLVEEYRTGKIGKDERIYERHYLSKEEFKYILNKYVEAYRLNNKWFEHIELLESYLVNGGNKDKYIEKKIDEDGTEHPGYRSHEKVDPMIEHIKTILSESIGSELLVNDLSKQINDKVLSIISDCKNYYKHNTDEEKFRFAITLGASPTSNAEIVKKYWKENTGEDIDIEFRLPELFWYYDHGYTDEDLALEFEDLGENWKEILTQKYLEEQAKIKKEQEERLKKLEEELKKQQDERKDS